MPHFIVEYTDNIKADADMRTLLKKANEVLIAQGAFPIGGIRSRAIELHDYVVADDTEDDAFVHATLKIGAGRGRRHRTRTVEGSEPQVAVAFVKKIADLKSCSRGFLHVVAERSHARHDLVA